MNTKKSFLSKVLVALSVLAVIGVVIYFVARPDKNDDTAENKETAQIVEERDTGDNTEKEAVKDDSVKKSVDNENTDSRDAAKTRAVTERVVSLVGASVYVSESELEDYNAYTDDKYEYFTAPGSDNLILVSLLPEADLVVKEDKAAFAESYIKKQYPDWKLEKSGWEESSDSLFSYMGYYKTVGSEKLCLASFAFDGNDLLNTVNIFPEVYFAEEGADYITAEEAIEIAKPIIEEFIEKEKEAGTVFTAENLSDYKGTASLNAHSGEVFWQVRFINDQDDSGPEVYYCEVNARTGEAIRPDKSK